jgi:glucose/arabinose dehydrogenase
MDCRQTRNLLGRRAAIGAAFALVAALHASMALAQGVAQNLGSFSDPVYAAAPSGDARLFVALRGGTIRVIENDATLATPFLDITDRVSNPPGLEGGFLGLVFAPDYAQTGVFYVYYTGDIDPSPAITFESRVSRFTVSPPSSNVADPQETVLFRLTQPYFNHNGGTIAIRDGFLYLGLGDGGSIEGGDPAERAQDDQSLFGKMLRFDLSQQQLPWMPVVWAKGFRNPFRFSFDRDNGDLYIGDVGENSREEIDVERADSAGGLNYGWDVMEGTTCFPDGPADPGEPPCNDPSIVLPVHEYAHGFPSPCAVTGGAVYRGSASPSLSGLYFFSDYCGHQISTFRWNRTTGIAEELTNRTSEFPPSSGGAIEQPVAITEDGRGELILVSLHGEVYRLVPEPESGMLAAAAVATLASLARRGRSRGAKQDRVAR